VDTVLSYPDLYRLLTLHVTNLVYLRLLMSLGSNRSSQMVRNMFTFFLTPCSFPKPKDYTLSVFCECCSLYSQLHFKGGSSTRSLNTQNVMVTGNHLS